MEYITIAVIVLAVVGITALLYYRLFFSSTKKKERVIYSKSKEKILKEANKKLAVNPKDKSALLTLADLYFSENDFEKAARSYKMLMGLITGGSYLDEYTITLRHGLSCAKIGAYDEAIKSLIIAKTIKDESAEANYYLGVIEFERKAYEKALNYFKEALKINPDHSLSFRYLGMCLRRLGHRKEAVRYLKSAVERDPSDKPVLFELGESYYNLGHNENALKIFTHLRPDPTVGPQSCLNAAIINFNNEKLDDALTDLNIGLKHTPLPEELKLELLYLRANVNIQLQDFDNALKDLKTIQSFEPNFKNINDLIQRINDFSSNRHLQTYIVSPASEFLTLCKSLVLRYFKDSTVKILDISVHKNEYADLLVEVNTTKWVDVCLFRFIRSTSQVGDTIVRDLATQIKELKAGRGVCACAGEFTIGARQFVEARQIDLIDKEQLLKWLAKL